VFPEEIHVLGHREMCRGIVKDATQSVVLLMARIYAIVKGLNFVCLEIPERRCVGFIYET